MFLHFRVESVDGFLSVVRALSIDAVYSAFPGCFACAIRPDQSDKLVCNGIVGWVVYNGRRFPRPL